MDILEIELQKVYTIEVYAGCQPTCEVRYLYEKDSRSIIYHTYITRRGFYIYSERFNSSFFYYSSATTIESFTVVF